MSRLEPKPDRAPRHLDQRFLSAGFIGSAEILTQVSAQGMAKAPAILSRQDRGRRGTPKELHHFPPRNPPTAIAAAHAPEVMSNCGKIERRFSQPQVQYADYRPAGIFGKAQKIRLPVKYNRVTGQPHPGSPLVADDYVGHFVRAKETPNVKKAASHDNPNTIPGSVVSILPWAGAA